MAILLSNKFTKKKHEDKRYNPKEKLKISKQVLLTEKEIRFTKY